MALVYECAREVEWICSDWQAFLGSKVPRCEVRKTAGGAGLVWSKRWTTIGAAIAGRTISPRGAHFDQVWTYYWTHLTQRLSTSWFRGVLELLPEFPTPWLKLPEPKRTEAVGRFRFEDARAPGFSVYPTGEPTPPLPWSFAFVVADIKDPQLFGEKLKRPSRPIDDWLRTKMSVAVNLVLALHQDVELDMAPLSPMFVEDLNRLIGGPLIYSAQRFSRLRLRGITRELLSQQPRDADLALLNRLLLEDAYREELARCASKTRNAANAAQSSSTLTVRICWGRNKGQITCEFEKWLAAQFEQRGLSSDRSRSGNASVGHFVKLNWLGQRRLLDAVGCSRARDILTHRVQNVVIKDCAHSLHTPHDQSGISRNKSKILDLIAQWFPEPVPGEMFSAGGYSPDLNQ